MLNKATAFITNDEDFSPQEVLMNLAALQGTISLNYLSGGVATRR